jgi:hypothetical protein
MNPMRKAHMRFAAFLLALLLVRPAVPAAATECIAPPPPKPVHHICGIVINELGEPIANVKATILKGGQEVTALQTGKDGKFSFDKVEAGNYRLRVEGPPGFLDAVADITVIKPAAKCGRALEVGLALGMGCSGARLVSPREIRRIRPAPGEPAS